MNQSHGILIFGFCFSMFLSWLWIYQDPSLQPKTGAKTAAAGISTGGAAGLSKPAELNKWLIDNGLDGLQSYMETAGKHTFVGGQLLYIYREPMMGPLLVTVVACVSLCVLTNVDSYTNT